MNQSDSAGNDEDASNQFRQKNEQVNEKDREIGASEEIGSQAVVLFEQQ